MKQDKHLTTWNNLARMDYNGCRDRSGDTVMFLHGSKLLQTLSTNEKKKVSDLVALSINESFIYFEKVLLFAEYQIKRREVTDKNNLIDMAEVQHDELLHLCAFRQYSKVNPYGKDYYRFSDGSTIDPGKFVQTYFPKRHKLVLVILKSFPSVIYPVAVLFEKFSVEIGKTLIKDHGRDSKDSFVILHYNHLKDEAKHVEVCEKKMKESFEITPWYLMPIHLLVTFFIMGHFLTVPLPGLKGVINNLPTVKNSFKNRCQFWLASAGITDKNNPFFTATRDWYKRLTRSLRPV